MKPLARSAWAACVAASKPTRAALIVAIALHWRTNGRTGECWPSYERTAQDMNLDRSNVKRGVAWLKDNGWVKIRHRSTPNGRQSNIYALRFAAWPGSVTTLFSVKQVARLAKQGYGPMSANGGVGAELALRWGQNHPGGGCGIDPITGERNKVIEPTKRSHGVHDNISLTLEDHIQLKGRLPQ